MIRQYRSMVIIVACILISALCTSFLMAAEKQQGPEGDRDAVCVGKYKGKKITDREFQDVLKKHQEWLKVYSENRESLEVQRDPRKANLCGATLPSIEVDYVDLEYADLREAVLAQLNVGYANFRHADLRRAVLNESELPGAHFEYANLRGAWLFSTRLSGAHLEGADLSEASLYEADLSGAYLKETNLSGADMYRTNLDHVDFQVKGLPKMDTIALAENLDKITYMPYDDNPEALNRLRKAFKDGGYRRQERALTYAIMHSEVESVFERWRSVLRSKKGVTFPQVVEAYFRYILFELTTKWGMKPGRALFILIAFIPLFSVPYALSLSTRGVNGIWRKWLPDRIRTDLGSDEPIRLRVGILEALGTALQFSILSAFSIGWREINVGNWIERLQGKEYKLYATGWVRTVSGVQSLISVYLLALWALTYFGSPFE